MKNFVFNIVYSLFLAYIAFLIVTFVIGVKLYYRKTEK